MCIRLELDLIVIDVGRLESGDDCLTFHSCTEVDSTFGVECYTDLLNLAGRVGIVERPVQSASTNSRPLECASLLLLLVLEGDAEGLRIRY